MFGVFTFSLTHFLAKNIFSRGMGGVQNIYFSGQKLELGGGGAYVKFPLWWGYGYFLELQNISHYKYSTVYVLKYNRNILFFILFPSERLADL